MNKNMIQANELRIGNFVKNMDVENGRFCKITELTEDSINAIYWYFYGGVYHEVNLEANDIEPIQLTMEWLLIFGAEKDINGDYFILINKQDDNRLYLVSGFVQMCKSYYAPIINWCHIKYVHQLQNLHFSLTGNELKSIEDVTKYE